MGVKLIPQKSGRVVFAKVPGGRPIRARWTKNRVEYTGASWGFDEHLVTWQLFHAGKPLALVGRKDEDLILDEYFDEQLIEAKVPFEAEASRGPLVWIPYTLSGSNHFGSAILNMELVVNLRQHTVRVRTLSSHVDLDT